MSRNFREEWEREGAQKCMEKACNVSPMDMRYCGAEERDCRVFLAKVLFEGTACHLLVHAVLSSPIKAKHSLEGCVAQHDGRSRR